MNANLTGEAHVSWYPEDESYEDNLIVYPQLKNVGAKEIKAVDGFWELKVTDVFGATATKQLSYDWKSPIPPGGSISAGQDHFSDVAAWYSMNPYIDDERLIIDNLNRADAQTSVVWVPTKIVFGDGTSIG